MGGAPLPQLLVSCETAGGAGTGRWKAPGEGGGRLDRPPIPPPGPCSWGATPGHYKWLKDGHRFLRVQVGAEGCRGVAREQNEAPRADPRLRVALLSGLV